jgi:hypothetical protein
MNKGSALQMASECHLSISIIHNAEPHPQLALFTASIKFYNPKCAL